MLLISWQLGYSQKLDAVRIEVPSDIDVEQFHVEPIGEYGALIFYESKEVNKEDKRKWYFGLFNTDLKQQWLKFIPLNDKIEYISSKRNEGNIYFLFKNINSERFEYGFYEIVTYNLRSGSFSQVSGSIPLKSKVMGFEVIGNTACMALNLKKRETDIVFINLDNGDVIPVNIDKGVPGYIQTLFADKVNNVFYVSIKQNRDRRYITDHIYCYSRGGKKLTQLDVEGTEALKYLRKFYFMPGKGSELLIFGTYDIVTGRTLSFKDIEEETDANSAGMFFLKFSNGSMKSLNYYDFIGFNNLTAAIGPDNISKLKLQNDTSQSNNLENTLSASFNLSDPYVLVNSKGNYIFSVEVYRPSYTTETRMDYDFYGRPYPYTYNVFNGYEFYDIIVASISPDGKMLWNNDFAMKDILKHSLSRNSVVFLDENYVTMAYVNDGNVFSQTIEGPSDIGISKMKIGTNFSKDNISQDENNQIVSWYSDYFLIYGYQKIKNRTLGEKSTRVVFYANRIAYK